MDFKMRNDKIEIPLSKIKILFIFFGAIAFVILGVLFLINPSMFISEVARNPTIIFIIGLASVLFFGLCAIVAFRKLFDKKVGLVIDSTGIMDNASGLSAGQIHWKNVTNIKAIKVAGENLLMIIVNNPDEFINRQKNPILKKMAKLNHINYGSPISLSANGLKCKFSELDKILNDQFEKWKI